MTCKKKLEEGFFGLFVGENLRQDARSCLIRSFGEEVKIQEMSNHVNNRQKSTNIRRKLMKFDRLIERDELEPARLENKVAEGIVLQSRKDIYFKRKVARIPD